MLTRRSTNDPHRLGWNVYFTDVCVGTITRRAGVPVDAPQWGWRCGFFPGMEPRQSRAGIAESFEEARAGFERAWSEIAPTITETHLNAWRRDRDWHAWKYRMWDTGSRMPTQNQNGRSRCFCGEVISIACSGHISAVHSGIDAGSM